MAQVLRPESIGDIAKGSNTTLTVGASLAIIGGQQRQTTQYTVTTSTSGINGIDTGAIAASQFYYIYLVISSGVLGAVISLSASAPTGFPAYKLVGQCTTNGSSQLVAANKIVDDNAPVGHVMAAMLNESQFRAIHGAGWILADGRSVAGSKYNTVTGSATAPDLRGVHLRGSNDGGSALGARADGNQDSAGTRAVGNFQNTALPNIQGDIQSGASGAWGNPASSSGAMTANNTSTQGWASAARSGWISGITFNAANSSSVYQSVTEARVRNVAVNHFIKIN
jgi:hypothetical protein